MSFRFTRREPLVAVALALYLSIAGSIGTTTSANAQEPAPSAAPQASPTIPNRPDRPPAEAINCARPTAQNRPELDAVGALQVRIDESSRQIVLSLSRIPNSATCYAVYREPSGTNPVLFAYAKSPIALPPSASDPVGINSAGRYCYSLIFGGTVGNGAPFEACIDVPPTFAPIPTPIAVVKPPPPPGVEAPNTGTGPGGSSGFAPLQVALGALGAAALVAGGYGSFVRRRARR